MIAALGRPTSISASPTSSSVAISPACLKCRRNFVTPAGGSTVRGPGGGGGGSTFSCPGSTLGGGHSWASCGRVSGGGAALRPNGPSLPAWPVMSLPVWQPHAAVGFPVGRGLSGCTGFVAASLSLCARGLPLRVSAVLVYGSSGGSTVPWHAALASWPRLGPPLGACSWPPPVASRSRPGRRLPVGACSRPPPALRAPSLAR